MDTIDIVQCIDLCSHIYEINSSTWYIFTIYRSELSVGTMVAGFDVKMNKPSLYYVDSEGTCVSGMYVKIYTMYVCTYVYVYIHIYV
jgi:20S proteasome alpha/beta subunit